MEKKFQVDRDILIFAFRYALGRMTYAPISVEEAIKSNINEISDGDIRLFIKEINECKNYGMQMDQKKWLSFKQYLQSILEKRKSAAQDLNPF